jgi:hypothetical protein
VGAGRKVLLLARHDEVLLERNDPHPRISHCNSLSRRTNTTEPCTHR